MNLMFCMGLNFIIFFFYLIDSFQERSHLEAAVAIYVSLFYLFIFKCIFHTYTYITILQILTLTL